MSPKTCLSVPVLLATLFGAACIDPAMQGGTDSTGETTDTSSSSSGSTTDPPGPTNTSVMTSDPPTSTTEPDLGCDDGVKNGSETDIDCGGGDCDPCVQGACISPSDCASNMCEADVCVKLQPSCLQLHEAQGELPSGDYPLDPNGDGAADGTFYCDMDPASPGWTRVFGPDSAGTWDPLKEGECGDLGELYGPYGMGDELTLDAAAEGVPHTELRVSAELVAMDSWDAFDNEQFLVKLGGADIFTLVCDYQSSFTCNQEMQHCGMDFGDGVLAFTTDPATHDGDDIALSFTSNLNEGVDNESWGIRAVAVFIK